MIAKAMRAILLASATPDKLEGLGLHELIRPGSQRGAIHCTDLVIRPQLSNILCSVNRGGHDESTSELTGELLQLDFDGRLMLRMGARC
jgi:hypothetical protein